MDILKEIQPTQDRVVVKWLDDLEYWHSHTIAMIQDEQAVIDAKGVDVGGDGGDYRRKVVRARVVKVGPGKKDEDGFRNPMQVKRGDTVLVTAWDDSEGQLPKGYALVREGDISAFLNEN